MKRKLLLSLAVALFSAVGAWAQTDVTSTYLTNADFSSTDGWTQYHSSEYWALGNGLIGAYTVANSYTSTTDDSHLGTEYCLGIQCRWNTNYAAFQQFKDNVSLIAGTYTITYDVQNTNTATASGANYENLFYVKVGDKTYTDNSLEWQNSHPDWATHTISFSVEEATTANITFSFGYQLNTNNGSGATPHIYVSHLKMTWVDPEAAAKAEKLEAAKYTLNGYIKKATALNDVLGTLTEAISTAQTIYDTADDYAEDYDNTVTASTTLNTAITTTLSGMTAVSLANANFDDTPNNTLNGDGTTTFGGTLSTATSNPDNTKDFSANTGDHAYLYEVTGWTQYSKFNSTASQGTTSEYGTAMPANGWSTNSTTIPVTDMFGASKGAALHLSAGWNDQARYQQTIKELPAGRYLLYYEIINQYSNTNIASNYIGVNGASGDFYGTTQSFVYSDLKAVEQGVWKAQAFEFDVAKDADINFSVGLTTSTSGSGNGAKLWIDNVLVYRIGDVVVTDADAEAIIAKVEAIIAKVEALDESFYNADEKSALATAKTTFEGSKTLDNYNALSKVLIIAENSATVYEAINTAIRNAEGWTSDAESVTAPIRTKYTNGIYSDETVPADIYAEFQAAEMKALAATSATDYSSVILNRSFETGDLTCWSAESRTDMGVKSASNATYSITSGDVTEGNWLFNSWGGLAENNVYQTIKNLPAGTYTLAAVLAGFKDEELVIAANETTNKVVVGEGKTFGYLTTVTFTLDATGDVVIKASNTKKAETSDASFIKADNFQLYVGSGIPGSAYKPNLLAAMEAVGCPKANIGTAAFQYPAAEVKKLTDALAAAQLVYDNASATKTDVENAISKLQADVKDVDLTLNVPTEGQLFSISLASGKWESKGRTFENEAVTYLAGDRSDMGGYNIKYSADANKNLAQAFTFTKVEKDNYKMSQIDAEGNVRYVSTGVPHGGNTSQVRTTTEAEKALIVTVIPTATEGIWNLWNTEANQYLGAQDEGFYTVNSHTNFAIKETTKPSITINTTEAGWGTVMLPFAVAELPSGVKAYTCAQIKEDAKELDMVEVTALEANKPYIIEGAWNQTLTGDAQGTALTSKVGILTGVYADTKAPADSYVLLKKNGKVAFHIVVENHQPTVWANHAYLTVPEGNSDVKAFFLGGEADGINAIENGQWTIDNAIYNMAGQRVSKAQKGIFIQNGRKMVVK